MKKKIVVTGLGILSPVGNNISTSWNNIISGISGIGRITKFDASNQKSQIAGEIKNFDPLTLIEQKELKKMGDYIKYAIFATDEALNDSNLAITERNAERIGVSIGVGIGGLPTIEDTALILHERGPSKVTPFFIPMCITNMAPGYISIRYGTKNYNATTTSACSSSNHAISAAASMIQNDEATVMIAGGAEATVCPLAIAGFSSMRALSRRNHDPEKASCPYDVSRDGFVLSEGAGVLILEEETHAKERGAKIYAELSGYGSSSDAFHITSPTVDGPSRAMKLAMANAGINPDQVDYINTHGTSTPIGDINEIKAIKNALGETAAKKASLSSTKSMTGHLLGGSGGIESVFTVLSIYHGVIPPTINVTELDPECDLDITPNVSKERKINYALSNSFGFGGTNSTLIFGRYKG